MRCKTVVRCADFDRSHDFYRRVLELPVTAAWHEPQGRGCIFSIGLEIYQMTPADPRFDEAFTRPVVNDKIDVQIQVDSAGAWAERLRGRWPFQGPEELPWGQRWIKLRDPDGLLIALYEEDAPPGFGHWLDAYRRAWETMDPRAAGDLFTEDATYQEDPFEPPMRGRDAIVAYWAEAAATQRDVRFGYQILAPDIARWHAQFTRIASGASVKLEGIFLVHLEPGGRCSAFREWWQRRETPSARGG